MIDWDQVITSMSLAPLQATCAHDSLLVDTEEVSTHSGTHTERTKLIRVYTCADCRQEFEDEL